MHRKRRDCPAYGQVCLKCNKSNHFASVCNAKRSEPVNVVFDEDDSESDLSVLQVVCQLDTGALCNVINYRHLSILLLNGTPKLGKRSVKLKMYDGSIMRPMVNVFDSGTQRQLPHPKVSSSGQPKQALLSAESCEVMGLLQFNLNIPQDVHVVEGPANPPLTKDAILNTYKDVFEGLRHIGDYTFVTDVFLSPYDERLKTGCWVLRSETSSRRSRLLLNG